MSSSSASKTSKPKQTKASKKKGNALEAKESSGVPGKRKFYYWEEKKASDEPRPVWLVVDDAGKPIKRDKGNGPLGSNTEFGPNDFKRGWPTIFAQVRLTRDSTVSPISLSAQPSEAKKKRTEYLAQLVSSAKTSKKASKKKSSKGAGKRKRGEEDSKTDEDSAPKPKKSKNTKGQQTNMRAHNGPLLRTSVRRNFEHLPAYREGFARQRLPGHHEGEGSMFTVTVAHAFGSASSPTRRIRTTTLWRA